MRLIDADAIVYESNKAVIRTGDCFIRECDIEREPTIEAEPVVRCRDCKHYGKLMAGDPNADKRCLITDLYEWRPEDWYCADGEKMDKAEE